jgi:AAA family ATP:ADP antiporter
VRRFVRWVLRRTDVRPGEGRVLLWSAVLFFALLAGAMLLRPVRDVMGVRSGWGRIPDLALATLVTMLLLQPLFGRMVARWPRRRFLPWVYRAFALQLLVLAAWALLAPPRDLALAQTYFVWLSVYNLFVVSVFWGFMADTWSPDQAKRLYGAVAIGGTAGAVAGGLAYNALDGLAGLLGRTTDDPRPSEAALVRLGALALEGAVRALRRVAAAAEEAPAGSAPPEPPVPAPSGVPPPRAQATAEARGREPLGGSAWDGFVRAVRSPYLAGIGLLVVCYTLTSTFGWAERVEIVKAAGLGDDVQGRISAWTETSVQTATLLGQLFLTGHLLSRVGVGWTLASGPVAAGLGFAALALSPALAAAVAFQIVTRVVHFAFAKPAQEALFSVVPRADKYKTKSLLDTFVYRFSDWTGLVTSAWILGQPGGTRWLPLVGLPLCALWLLLALLLGRARARRAATAPAA